MKTFFKIAVLIYLALVCQAGLARELTCWEVQPAFLAMLLVLFANNWSGNKALLLAAMVGLAEDALRGEAFGVGMFLAVLGVALCQWTRDEKKSESNWGRSSFLLCWYLFGVNLTVMGLDGKFNWWQTVLLQSAGSVVYSGAILLTLLLLQRLLRRLWSGSRNQVAWR
ncbi:MAG: rod shape-determining protein MreD [Planctomycetaceae bacterium]